MPPHCDTMDGPVVTAAKMALKAKNVKLILPWVPEEAEQELTEAFKKTLSLRKKDSESSELIDRWFFETAVRLHRAGEGMGFTGLKPAGLDWGPVIPEADKAVDRGNPDKVIDFLKDTIEKELRSRFNKVMNTKNYDKNNIKDAREYVHRYLQFVLFSHHLYKYITTTKELHD
ncbi:MAG: DUF6448 family protein [Candidatus Lokiarchaeota archaeon]